MDNSAFYEPLSFDIKPKFAPLASFEKSLLFFRTLFSKNFQYNPKKWESEDFACNEGREFWCDKEAKALIKCGFICTF